MALLIGDSIFARLLVGRTSLYHPLSNSLCVRGARVSAIKELLKDMSEIPSPAVLLIGINDLSNPHDLVCVWDKYLSIVNLLLRKGVFLYICPLLPVANNYFLKNYGSDLARFNFWIRNLRQKKNVKILSFESIFRTNNVFNLSVYCPFIKNRVDYLHPNAKGLALMHSTIQSSL